MTKKKTTEQFIEKARSVHGDVYSYEKSVYVNSIRKIEIVCKTHGSFMQSPGKHIGGCGCATCGRNKLSVLFSGSKDSFVEKANKIHGNKYDYSNSNYRNARSKIAITCPLHGDFLQTVYEHLSGGGCRKCANQKISKSKSLNLQTFIDRSIKVHGDLYDYSKSVYIGTASRIEIVCKKHGSFWQVASNHMIGCGCRLCKAESISHALRGNRESFIQSAKKIHGEMYDYSKVVYTTAIKKVEIICGNHGSFFQSPNAHLSGKGCSRCKSSKYEDHMSILLNDLGFAYNTEIRFDSCKSKGLLPFDFQVFTDNGFCLIEIHGIQHYEPIHYFGGEKAFQSTIKRDSIKSDWAKKNNIPLLCIHYKEFEVGKEHLQSILIDFLGQGNSVKRCDLDSNQFKQLSIFDVP